MNIRPPTRVVCPRKANASFPYYACAGGVLIILLSGLVWMVSGFSNTSTKSALKELSQKFDPASLELEQGANFYVQRTHIIDEMVELGIIHMKDGSTSKYWFRSHHMSEDNGGTWFLLSDGKKLYMAGYFCCEAIFPEEQFASLDDLRDFIREHSGKIP